MAEVVRLYQTFHKPLGAFQFFRYNGGGNGGAANDENRGRQGIFQEGGFARRHRRAVVLHFQIRLHEGWGAGSFLALDTLRPALRHPSDVRVDRAGGDSLGGGAALFVLNFVIGGIIGGFVLVWRLLVAAWYVPLTIYRLIVGY